MITPPLGCQQNTRPDQGRQIMHDSFLTARIAQLRHHPLNRPGFPRE
jgi:hypothetical protein